MKAILDQDAKDCSKSEIVICGNTTIEGKLCSLPSLTFFIKVVCKLSSIT